MFYITTANDNEAYRKMTDGRLVLVLKEQVKKWELAVERSQKRAGEFSADDVAQELESLLPIYENNSGYKTYIGTQRVLFGPQAIAELVTLCIWSGFFGRAYEEGRAWTSKNKPGDKLFSELVSIHDNPDNPLVFAMPFDFSGKRRRLFKIVEKGIFAGVCYDSQTAAKYKKERTGHDLLNWNLVFACGSGPGELEAALRVADNALYIPHLHYSHLPDPTRGVFTGSSRFNAMLIRNGSFVAPLFSSRVTDSIPSVFTNIIAVSSAPVAQNQSSTYERRAPEAMAVPGWLLCDNVRISDVADSF